MVTGTPRFFIRYLIFPFLITLFTCGLSGGQAISSLEPPSWLVGDWWTVRCQVYDEAKVFKGVQPGWRPNQTWRFQVEKIDQLADQPYYVVTVTPQQDNDCPYSFRYWFRVADRFVGRRELMHPPPAPTKPQIIGPPTVTRNFYHGPAVPYFTDEFPTLPVVMPLFGVAAQSLTFEEPALGEKVSQKVEEIPLLTMMEKVNPGLKAQNEASLAQGNLLITLSKESNIRESQYWNQGLPFPVYGQRFDQTYTSRRYWLVEVGKK